MDAEKRERLEKAGFHIGTAAEFLGLTPEQSELIEIKLVLIDALSSQRKSSGLSQAELPVATAEKQPPAQRTGTGRKHRAATVPQPQAVEA